MAIEMLVSDEGSRSDSSSPGETRGRAFLVYSVADLVAFQQKTLRLSACIERRCKCVGSFGFWAVASLPIEARISEHRMTEGIAFLPSDSHFTGGIPSTLAITAWPASWTAVLRF